MSLQKFLSARLETIQKSQAIDIMTHGRLRSSLIGKVMQEVDGIETYVPCSSCSHNQGGTCLIDKDNPFEIPVELKPLGCGKGFYDDIPF